VGHAPDRGGVTLCFFPLGRQGRHRGKDASPASPRQAWACTADRPPPYIRGRRTGGRRAATRESSRADRTSTLAPLEPARSQRGCDDLRVGLRPQAVGLPGARCAASVWPSLPSWPRPGRGRARHPRAGATERPLSPSRPRFP
jgi:hypothetical protein